MVKYLKDKNGQFAGSIGDGKERVPTAQLTRPTVPGLSLNETGTEADNYQELHERFTSLKGQHPGQALLDEYISLAPARRAGFMGQRTGDEETYMRVLIDYASDARNRKKVRDACEQIENAGFGGRDPAAVNALRNIIRKGEERGKEKKEEKRLEANRRGRLERAKRRSEGTEPSSNYRAMRPSQGVQNGTIASLAQAHPDLVEEWHPDNPYTPDEVQGSGPVAALWKCKTCGHEWQTTIGNRIRYYESEGYYVQCGNCTNRLRVRASRDKLDNLVQRYQTDPEAFDALPPAIKESILIRMGFLSGGDAAFRPVGEALARGDITLREVLSASNLDDISARIDFEASERDDTNRELSLDEISRMGERDTARGAQETAEDRVNTILNTGQYISMLDPTTDREIVDQIIHSGVQKLWSEVHNNPDELDSLIGRVEADAESGKPQSVIAKEFMEQYSAVQAMQLPEGYNRTRVLASGAQIEIEPFLTQKMFALEVEKNRRVANLSGTGAGKTLSALLASRHIGAQETVLFVPSNVAKQWGASVTEAFPDVEVRVGPPKIGEDVDASGTGRPRVWVVAYGMVSSDDAAAKKRLRLLEDRTDMIIFDEAHRIKDSSAQNTSKRRKVLEGFSERAGRNNDQMAVVAMTATPVVNDLEEAASFARLVTGRKSAGFRTKATKENALNAHRVISGLGVRIMPSYLSEVTREDIPISLNDSSMRKVAQEYARITNNGSRGTNHPATIERALLPAKMPKVIETVKNSPGSTLIYSHYREGMVEPILDGLRKEGVKAEAITGDTAMKERNDIIRRFQTGETQVIVGTQAISTGVDGLQDSCHHLINLSPPWTAADEEQLMGRLNRTGQHHRVKVTSIVTEADLGDGFTWSYDKDRHQRIHFKRGLADAVTDGVIPQGHVETDSSLSQRAGEALLSFFRGISTDQDQ